MACLGEDCSVGPLCQGAAGCIGNRDDSRLAPIDFQQADNLSALPGLRNRDDQCLRIEEAASVMQKLRSLHHHRGQTMIDELDVEGMEGVEGRAHAGEDNRLELALLEAGCESI